MENRAPANDYRRRPRADKFYTMGEVRRMLEFALAADETHHLALLLLYAHGLRSVELLSLTVGDASLCSLAIHAAKGGISARVPLYCSEDRLFDEPLSLARATKGRHPGQRLFDFHRGTLYQIVKRYARLAGVPAERSGPHAFRHSLALHSRERGLDIADVQRLLRHVSIASTGRYFRTSLTEAAARLQEVLGV